MRLFVSLLVKQSPDGAAYDVRCLQPCGGELCLEVPLPNPNPTGSTSTSSSSEFALLDFRSSQFRSILYNKALAMKHLRLGRQREDASCKRHSLSMLDLFPCKHGVLRNALVAISTIACSGIEASRATFIARGVTQNSSRGGP